MKFQVNSKVVEFLINFVMSSAVNLYKSASNFIDINLHLLLNIYKL